LGFFNDLSFWPHYDPGVDSASTEMITRIISWGIKAVKCAGLTKTYHLHFANCLEIWEPQPPGAIRACPGL